MPTVDGNLTIAERRQVRNWLDRKVTCVCGQRMVPHPSSPISDRHTYAAPYLPTRSVVVVCTSCARVEALDPVVMGYHRCQAARGDGTPFPRPRLDLPSSR